jgi:hypothetical protein
MLGIINLVRRTIEGSVLSILIIAILAVFGVSETVNMALAERSVASMLFLIMLAIVLADLIGKFLTILTATFPDLLPAVDDEDVKRASLIQRLRPGQTVTLLSGAYAARLVMFLLIFGLLGTSYAFAPRPVQDTLFGNLGPLQATEIFLREGLAGSVGYFLFFLGPDHLKPITSAILSEPLVASNVDGDTFLVGLRVYGLAFMLSILRTLATPITYLRARRHADRITAATEATA